MNRFISTGLSVAVAPAILLPIAKSFESEDLVTLSDVTFFSVAVPLGTVLVVWGLALEGRRRVDSHPFLMRIRAVLRDTVVQMRSWATLTVKRIREPRPTEERPARQTVHADRPVSELEASVRKNRSQMLALGVSYLLSSLVIAIVFLAQYGSTWGGPFALALLLMFPVAPFFLLADMNYLVLWAVGFVFCWAIVSSLLSTSENDGER